jgi:hypothetical protein
MTATQSYAIGEARLLSRAFLFALWRRWSYGLGSGDEAGEYLFEAGRIFYVQSEKSAIDLAVEVAEDLAGANFYVMGGTGGLEELNAFDPADRSRDLANESVAYLRTATEKAGVNVGSDRETWIIEGDGLEGVSELILRGMHESAVKRCTDGEHESTLGASLLAGHGGALHGSFGAGDDGLLGGVEIGRRDNGVDAGCGLDRGAGGIGGVLEGVKSGGGLLCRICGVAGRGLGELVGDGSTNIVDAVGCETKDGSHGSLAGGNGVLHELPTDADDADRVGEGDCAGGDVRGVLTEGMAGSKRNREAAGRELGREDTKGGDGGRQNGRLGVLGQLKVFFGALEDELGEREPKGVVGLFEDRARGRNGVKEGAAHTDVLGSLAGEEEGYLRLRGGVRVDITHLG